MSDFLAIFENGQLRGSSKNFRGRLDFCNFISANQLGLTFGSLLEIKTLHHVDVVWRFLRSEAAAASYFEDPLEVFIDRDGVFFVDVPGAGVPSLQQIGGAGQLTWFFEGCGAPDQAVSSCG